MKLGKAFCLSGICSIAVALALAYGGADARAVVSPSELDGVLGGACGMHCAERAGPSCGQEEETGECKLQWDPYSGQYCPPEERRDSCNQDEYMCVETGYPSGCIRTPADCPGYYLKYNCIRDNYGAPGYECIWLCGQYYPCVDRDESTYQVCTDNT